MSKQPESRIFVDATVLRSRFLKQERGPYSKFRVIYYEGGMRQQISRSDFGAAKEEANRVIDRLTAQGGSVLQLTGVGRLAYVRAQEQLASINVAIDVAAAHYEHAPRLLGETGTLTDAVQFYLRHGGNKVKSKDVAIVVEGVPRRAAK
jgi:hypothetical protein